MPASFPISVGSFFLTLLFSLNTFVLCCVSLCLLLNQVQPKLHLSSSHLVNLCLCVFPFKLSGKVNQPLSNASSPHSFSSPGSSRRVWPLLALVDGSCCSCPYLVLRHSSSLRPCRSHRHIPATIDLDGTQDSHC